MVVHTLYELKPNLNFKNKNKTLKHYCWSEVFQRLFETKKKVKK